MLDAPIQFEQDKNMKIIFEQSGMTYEWSLPV